MEYWASPRNPLTLNLLGIVPYCPCCEWAPRGFVNHEATTRTDAMMRAPLIVYLPVSFTALRLAIRRRDSSARTRRYLESRRFIGRWQRSRPHDASFCCAGTP